MSYLTKGVELKLRKVFRWTTDKVLGGVVGIKKESELIETLNNFSFSSSEKREIIEKLKDVMLSTRSLFDSYRTLTKDDLSNSNLEGARKWIKANYEMLSKTGNTIANIYSRLKDENYLKLFKATKLPLENRFKKLENGNISKSDKEALILELKKGKQNKEIKELIAKLQKNEVKKGEINELKQYAVHKADLRARNEAGNLYALELESLMLEENLEFFKWRTLKDNRVRPEHADREGVIYSVDEGELPGQDWGCRCWAEPIKKKEDR